MGSNSWALTRYWGVTGSSWLSRGKKSQFFFFIRLWLLLGWSCSSGCPYIQYYGQHKMESISYYLKKPINFYCSKIMIWYVFKFNNHMHFSFKLPMYSIKKQIFKSYFLSSTVVHYSPRCHFLLMYLVASSVRTFHLLSLWNCSYWNSCMTSSFFFSVLLKS